MRKVLVIKGAEQLLDVRRKKVLNAAMGISCSASLRFKALAAASAANEKEAKAEFFSPEVSPKNIRRNLRKKTCGDGRSPHRLPSLRLDWAAAGAAWRAKEAKRSVLSAIFSGGFQKMFGKRIDGKRTGMFAQSLSLNGKLFEIYFVRLIGTPNQQFKKR